MAKIIIHGPTYGQPQPVRLTIGSRASHATRALPVNREITVDADELAALTASDHTFTIIEGDTAADEAEQAPAPAGSGDGGEKDGGGAAGSSTTETALEPIPPGFLDRSVTAIIADLGGLTPGQLNQAIFDETSGKTRKSLIAALNEAIAARAA